MTDMLSTPKLNAALAKAVKVIESIPLDGTLDTGAEQGRRRIQFDYATAEGILAAIRGPLACEGISVCLIDSDFVEGRAAVRVTLRVAHSSGESFVMSKVRPIDKGGADGTCYDRSETIAVKRLLKSLLLIPAVEEQEEQHGAKVTDETTKGSMVESSPPPITAPTKGGRFGKTAAAESMSAFAAEADAEFAQVEEEHAKKRERIDLSDDSPAPRDEVIANLRRFKEDLERLGYESEDRKKLFLTELGESVIDPEKGPIVTAFTRNHLTHMRNVIAGLKQRSLEESVA